MTNQEIIDKLLSGEMKLYQVDREVSAKEATDIRREFLEQKYSINLENISNYTLDMERASARNIENSIGVLQLPMGIAGPLKINGEFCKREVFVPLATSEGALVASINRGASTITASGGANVRVVSDIMTRAPAIKCSGASTWVPLCAHIEKADRLYKSPFFIVLRVCFSGFGSPGYTADENTSCEIS